MMKEELRNRKGMFEISRPLLEMYPDVVMEFMSKVVIVRAEHMIIKDVTEYHAYSPLFRELEGGEAIPKYNFELTRDEAGNIPSIIAKELTD